MCPNPNPNPNSTPNPSPNLEERDHVHAEDLLANVVIRLDDEGDEAPVGVVRVGRLLMGAR